MRRGAPPDYWLQSLRERLSENGTLVRTGGDYDWWDLRVQAGLAGATRIQMTIEEHGGGKQLVRFRSRPRASLVAVFTTVLFLCLAAGAVFDGHLVVAGVLAFLALVPTARVWHECDAACGLVGAALEQMLVPGDVVLVNGRESLQRVPLAEEVG